MENEDNLISFSGYSAYGSTTAVVQPEIVTALQQMNLEIEVINRAIEVYYEVIKMHYHRKNDTRGRTIKGGRRLRLLFYCVFTAYIRLNNPVDPCFAAELIGLPFNSIEQAITENSPPGVIVIDPTKMIKFYVGRINKLMESTGTQYNEASVVEGVTQVIDICRSTEVGEEWTQNTAVKLVAISAVYFYLNDIKGINMSKNIILIEKTCYLSWACIKRYYEQIGKYYNCDDKDHKYPRSENIVP